ncbi:MAG: FAD-dependent oxidoreductase, partial [Pirellulales bacterium]
MMTLLQRSWLRFGTIVLLLFVRTPVFAAATYDLVIYGGTAAGVIAAVQATRMGKSVVVVSPNVHLGGMTSGGLGWTDAGDKSVIGGLSREFYHRIWRHYQKDEAWRWQDRKSFANRGQGTPAMDGESRTMWTFEPHVAEQVLEELVREHAIEVRRSEWLDREHGVVKEDSRIVSITTRSHAGVGEPRESTYAGRMFIDATYEGDLMAAAGVTYHVGRESRDEYGEEWNGNQIGVLHHSHHFGILKQSVDPYVVAGDPTSGLLPRVSPDPPGEYGATDKRVQAYCFRMCLTNVAENSVPFPRPA